MTDDTAARLRKLAEREVRDRHDAAQWCASHSERDDRDEWAYVSLMDLRNAVDGATILALLDERDAAQRESMDARNALDAHKRVASEWHRRMQQAEAACAAAYEGKPRSGGKSVGRSLANMTAMHYRGERDAAMALLRRRGRALVAIESIARNSETAIVLPDIARIAADALLGGGEG